MLSSPLTVAARRGFCSKTIANAAKSKFSVSTSAVSRLDAILGHEGQVSRRNFCGSHGLSPCVRLVAATAGRGGPSRGLHASSALRDEVQVIVCPAFAESISEGDLRWEKAVGDSVGVDEVIAEVETDKTSVPIPSQVAGVIEELLVEDGATVTPGKELAKVKVGAGGGAAAPAAKPAEKKDDVAAAPPPPPPPPAASSAGPVPTAPPPAPPIPTAPLSETPVSAIRPAPLAASAASGPAPIVRMPPEDPTKEIAGTRSEHRVKMNRMRLTVAKRLKEAQNTTAMLTTFNELDMSALMQLRKENQDAFTKRHGIKLGFMSAFVKASAYALTLQPTVNAVIEGQEIIYRDYVDISVAVATPKGLVVPILRNVHDMNYADIEKGIAALGEKAKKNQLAMEDMDGGTFTISNGGVFGSLFGTPIINPPQSAILGMHGSFERPVVRNGQVVIRPMMFIALTYDHRLVDGREAVTFLKTIKRAVEDPRTMFLGL